MPLKSAAGRRHYNREYQRAYRARKRAEKQPAKVEPIAPDLDPIDRLAAWSETTLRVPAGHVKAGEAMTLPPYIVDFLRDAWRVKEAALVISRKNAKSAGVAVLCLGLLCGPLRQPGLRIGVASISKEKAGELRAQVQSIAEASGLSDLVFYRTPSPGRVESSTGTLELLASECGGHASGFDLVLCDELGLFRESERAFVASLRSSLSAKDGRFVALSVFGSSPFIPEMVARKDDADVAVHVYQADRDARLDDEAQWHRANPGLSCGVKSLDYMRRESKRVLATPSDQGLFRSLDLNIPQDPTREMICSMLDFQLCVGGDAERDGHCVAAFDLGGSSSMCAFVALWPWTGRLECYGAFPGMPTLTERGHADGVGGLYARLHDAGELEVFDGHRTTPVAVFLERCFERLRGETVLAVGCDRYRRAEAETALTHAGLEGVPMQWRGQGAHAVADGSHDVRAFQRAVLQHRLHVTRGAGLLAHAIAESSVRYDAAGNPAVEKGRGKGRIDALQSAVIAAGLGELVEAHGKPTPLRVLVAG